MERKRKLFDDSDDEGNGRFYSL